MIATDIQPFHVTGLSKAKGKSSGMTASPGKAATPVFFHIDLNVHFDPAVDNAPAGTLVIQSDVCGVANGTFIASTIEFVNSFGKKDPTIYLTGQCRSNPSAAPSLDGCRYWVMLVNHSENRRHRPDIVGFCIQDCEGNRIAYGTSLYGNIEASAN